MRSLVQADLAAVADHAREPAEASFGLDRRLPECDDEDGHGLRGG
jgi:hypothetical protein